MSEQGSADPLLGDLVQMLRIQLDQAERRISLLESRNEELERKLKEYEE